MKTTNPQMHLFKTCALSGALLFSAYNSLAQNTTATTPQTIDTAYAPVLGNLKPEEVLSAVEHAPEYPGGQQALLYFLANNVHYPYSAKRRGIEGRVVAQFVIDKTGKVRNIEIKQRVYPDCDKEVIRVLKLMPLWKPGMQDGKPVNVYYTLPVSFKLQE